jgi:hypothetical protein
VVVYGAVHFQLGHLNLELTVVDISYGGADAGDELEHYVAADGLDGEDSERIKRPGRRGPAGGTVGCFHPSGGLRGTAAQRMDRKRLQKYAPFVVSPSTEHLWLPSVWWIIGVLAI